MTWFTESDFRVQGSAQIVLPAQRLEILHGALNFLNSVLIIKFS